MDFLSDGSVLLGYEKKSFVDQKSGNVREWLIVRLAALGTGKMLELNSDVDMEPIIKEIPAFSQVKIVVGLAPRQQGGLSGSLKAIMLKK